MRRRAAAGRGCARSRMASSTSAPPPILFTHQGACDALPIASLHKVDALVRYGAIADVCIALALDALEYNCLVALVDHACTGTLAQSARVRVTVEGYDDAVADDDATELVDAAWRAFEDGFVPSYQHVTDDAVVHDGARDARERLADGSFPPAALLRRQMPAWFDDAWMAELRTRYVAVKTLSRAWTLPQTHIRLALRRLHATGLVDECTDYFCLDPRTLAMRLIDAGVRTPGVARAFARGRVDVENNVPIQ